MHKIVGALVATAAATIALAAAPSSAGAHSPVDLHTVNLKNATIPGSTCDKSSPIQLHNGHGTGGTVDGQHLSADAFGDPVYGDLTHDGRDEALLYVICSAPGGAHRLDVKQNYVAFTGSSGAVSVLGVIVAKHRFFNTDPTVLRRPRIVDAVVRQPELLYFPTDPYCCPSEHAGTRWWMHNGALRVKNSWLQITDKIVGQNTVGHAVLRETKQDLAITYGNTLHSALYSPGCRDYWHGAHQARSFNAFIDTTTSPGVFGIYAPSGAVTRAGIGKYATLHQIHLAYPGHPVLYNSGAHGTHALVKFAHSWIDFTFDASSSPATVDRMSVGTWGFVSGHHTCSS